MIENIEKVLGIVATVLGAGWWLIVRLEKRAAKREEDRLRAAAIDKKLLDLEANYGRLTEQIQDVRKDFARFVERMLFNKPI